jgi:hypothetical protein
MNNSLHLTYMRLYIYNPSWPLWLLLALIYIVLICRENNDATRLLVGHLTTTMTCVMLSKGVFTLGVKDSSIEFPNTKLYSHLEPKPI